METLTNNIIKIPVVKNSRLVSEENMRLNSLTNGQGKITILESAATSIAEIAWFIESKGLPETAKHFVNNTFDFFEKLSEKRIVHKACTYKRWKTLKYRCVPFKKNYVVTYLN